MSANQKNNRRKGYNKDASAKAIQIANGQSGPVDSSASGSFRAHVLRLRNAGNSSSIQAAVVGIRSALVAAAVNDTELDEGMLGMAASLCARHGQQELVGLLCAHTACHLKRCSGRSVSELASAAAKLGCVERAFARAVVNFCASAPSDTFVGLRDVAMLLIALRAFNNVEILPAACGLAHAALPHLDDQSSPRDLAELMHAMIQFLGSSSMQGVEFPAEVTDILCYGVRLFKRSLHQANARDVAMVAGAIASLWGMIGDNHETLLRTCLLDIAQLIRFRRAEFNAKDLSLLSMAFAKADLPSEDLADVLSDEASIKFSQWAPKDISLVLWAAARLPNWSNQPFVQCFSEELLSRDLGKLHSKDLCSAAHSFAKLGLFGGDSLDRITNEAFHRQLYSFTCKDKAMLLWSLAKVQSSNKEPLLRLLVRSLAIEDISLLDRELANSLLWSLARVWNYVQLPDPFPQVDLLNSLCTVRPWTSARLEVCNALWAFGQLPVQSKSEAWTSLIAAADELTASNCSLHEASSIISGLAACPELPDGRGANELAVSFLDVISKRVLTESETISSHDAQLLLAAFSQTSSWQVSSELHDAVRSHAHDPALNRCGTGPAYDTSSSSRNRSPCSSQSTMGDGSATATAGLPLTSSPKMLHYDTPTPQHSPSVHPRKSPSVTIAAAAELLSAIEAMPHTEINIQRHAEINNPNGHGHVQHEGHGNGHHDSHSYGHGHVSDECTGGGSSAHNADGEYQCCVGHECASDGHDCSEHEAENTYEVHGVGHGQVYGGDVCEKECCPALVPTVPDGPLLNSHCNFHGHCIKLKNTFLHIQCNHMGDSDSEDCPVCKLTRSRSCHGKMQRGRHRSVSDATSDQMDADPFYLQPPRPRGDGPSPPGVLLPVAGTRSSNESRAARMRPGRRQHLRSGDQAESTNTAATRLQ